jgi:hypothetical protein
MAAREPARRRRSRSRKRTAKRNPLIADVVAFIERYVVMSSSQVLVTALWVVHTHCAELLDQTPYLAITSPEKQCGKTRLLEVLEVLVREPWKAVLPSEAVLFRHIDQKKPTLLLDEIDTIFNPRVADRYEGHRALLNAGHRRGDKVPRCVGTKQEIREFDPFCPKALAGIGTLPDTVADRSIPIRLARRTRSEKVEAFKRRDVDPVAERLRGRIEAWGTSKEARKASASRPTMPEELSDRMQEGCEPLIAMADALGCGQEARAAVIELFSGERLDEQETMRVRLLADLKAIFEQFDADFGKRVRNVPSVQLIERLRAIEEAPWDGYYSRGIEPRDLSSLLKHYGIQPRPIKFKSGTHKGYRRDDFADAWERYL